MNRSIKIYLTNGTTKIATFTYEGLHDLSQLLAPLLFHDGEEGATPTCGLRVAIGHTQKQAKDERLTIVSPTKSLKWHNDEPFDGSYDSIYYALVDGINEAIANFNNN
jgi:hypothetical protein